MVNRLILHIGAPKCGSTFLQRVLLNNGPNLVKRGFYYPHDGSVHPGNAADLSKYDFNFMKKIASDGVHTLLLSHEDLLYGPDQSKAFLEITTKAQIELQIVAFMRPFNEIVFGDFSQHMKQFFEVYLKDRKPYGGNGFAEFARARIEKMKACRSLSIWQKRFSETPMIVTQHTQIREVFDGLLGVELDWTLPSSQVNRSLRIEDCERICSLMQNVEMSDHDIREFFKKSFHDTELKDAGRTLDRINFIEALASEENSCLESTFSLKNRITDTSGAR